MKQVIEESYWVTQRATRNFVIDVPDGLTENQIHDWVNEHIEEIECAVNQEFDPLHLEAEVDDEHTDFMAFNDEVDDSLPYLSLENCDCDSDTKED